MAMPTEGIRITGHHLMRAMPEVWQLEQMLAHDDLYSPTEIRQTASRALALLPGDRGMSPLRAAISRLVYELPNGE